MHKRTTKDVLQRKMGITLEEFEMELLSYTSMIDKNIFTNKGTTFSKTTSFFGSF